MKKNVILSFVLLCSVFALFGCQKIEDTPPDNGAGRRAEAKVDKVDKDFKSYLHAKAQKANQYVSISKYMGLPVSKTERKEVTDKDVEEYIKEELEYHSSAKDTDKTVEPHDSVSLSMNVTDNGKPISEEVNDEVDFVVGDDSNYGIFTLLQSELDKVLVGKKKGDKVSFDFKVTDKAIASSDDAERYDSLNGRTLHVDATINSVAVVTIPDLTEEWVKENTEYQTIAEYREGVKNDLISEANTDVESLRTEDVISGLLENIKWKERPEKEIEEREKTILKYYQDSELQNPDFDETSFKESIEQDLLLEYAIFSIADKEGISLEEGYDKPDTEEEEYRVNVVYGCLPDEMDEEMLHQYQYDLLREKVERFLVKNSVEEG